MYKTFAIANVPSDFSDHTPVSVTLDLSTLHNITTLPETLYDSHLQRTPAYNKALPPYRITWPKQVSKQLLFAQIFAEQLPILHRIKSLAYDGRIDSAYTTFNELIYYSAKRAGITSPLHANTQPAPIRTTKHTYKLTAQALQLKKIKLRLLKQYSYIKHTLARHLTPTKKKPRSHCPPTPCPVYVPHTTVVAPTALTTSLTQKLHDLKLQLKDTHKAFKQAFKSSVMISAYKRSKALIRGLKQNPSLLWRTLHSKPRAPLICTPESLAAFYTTLFDGTQVDEQRLHITPDGYPAPTNPTHNHIPSSNTFDNLMSFVTHDELVLAAKKMKKRKSPGPDLIPMECITKAIIPKPPPANPAYPNQQSPPDYPVLDALSDIYNQCIESHMIPTPWKHVRISSVFKKGDPYDPANYRPISLSATSYRLFTSLNEQWTYECS